MLRSNTAIRSLRKLRLPQYDLINAQLRRGWMDGWMDMCTDVDSHNHMLTVQGVSCAAILRNADIRLPQYDRDIS